MTSNLPGGAGRGVGESCQSVRSSDVWGATGPPPSVDSWPTSEVLDSHDVVMTRPRIEDAAAVLALQSDPGLHIDVASEWRVLSHTSQADDLRRFVEHWHTHGFGYWLVWAGDDGDIPTVTGTGSDHATSGNLPDGAGVLPVGIAGLRWLWWRDRWVLNVFVRFARAVHGQGMATAVLAHAITRLDADLQTPTTVVVRTRDANIPMVALARRLGMVDTGHESREMGTYRVLERLVGGERGPQQRPPDVRARQHGPWIVQPHVVVIDHGGGRSGTVVSAHRRHHDVAVCRCGMTGAPPICDRTHAGVDMQQLACNIGGRSDGTDIECCDPLDDADDAVVTTAAACPPDTMLVLRARSGRGSGSVDDSLLVIGPGLTVELVGGRSVRPSVPVWACRCGRHVEAVRPT